MIALARISNEYNQLTPLGCLENVGPTDEAREECCFQLPVINEASPQRRRAFVIVACVRPQRLRKQMALRSGIWLAAWFGRAVNAARRA
jgi:hypothetical protein